MPIVVKFNLNNSNYGHIHLANPDDNIRHLKKPHEIVIPMEKITIIIDYPLEKPIEVILEAESVCGFKRAELAKKISVEYKRIYHEEDEAVGDPGTVTPFMFNRAKSSGPYGIWGHYITDLDLTRVEQISCGQKNKFRLIVES